MVVLGFTLCLLAHGCRPILVLPPADIQVVYCNLTEAENDFYKALFKKSKVQMCMVSLSKSHLALLLDLYFIHASIGEV